jgi:haloacetate dehalogenase
MSRNDNALFPGFASTRIQTSGAGINLVHGGEGPPLLLLHGYPQTHVIWHKVAQALAGRYRVVATDLRGYGDSDKPHGLADHGNYSKRAMALEPGRGDARARTRAVFSSSGTTAARVSRHRMALDHPACISKLAVLDIVPTRTMYMKATGEFAKYYYHWFFLIRPEPFPETLIGGNPEFFLLQNMGSRHAGLKHFAPEALAEYIRCFSDPAAIHATCEDYRAAESIDLVHDEADLDRKVTCPLLVLWGQHGVIERCFQPLADWGERAEDVRGRSLPCGHYIPEEAPGDLLGEIVKFLA